MNKDVRDAQWRGDPESLEAALAEAQKVEDDGDRLAADSQRLSAFYTQLTKAPAWQLLLRALPPACAMLLNWRKLNHNQLDVTIQFWLKLRQKVAEKIGIFSSGHPASGTKRPFLRTLALREVDLANQNGKPHQKALAQMTYAEVLYAVDCRRTPIQLAVDRARDHFKDMALEEDQEQALNQMVRVLKKIGVLYMQPEMYSSAKASFYLLEALELARQTGATDQIEKIQVLLDKL